MSFIDLELDAIEEDKPVAEGEYTLVVTSVKEREKDGEVTGLLVIHEIQGVEGAANVIHNLTFAKPTDDPDKAKSKKLFMKRYLVLFNIPFAGGIDLAKFPGSTAKCFLKQEEYQGVVSNKINLPPIK